MMKHIYTLGEIVYDIIWENGIIRSGLPGGAMLNTAVSLSRLGNTCSLISRLGNDSISKIIETFLKSAGICNDHIKHYDGLTPLAFAVLDEHKNAAYQFYKQNSANDPGFIFPEIRAGDYLLFGSFFSLQDHNYRFCLPFIRKSRENGALIMYDPNIRRKHNGEMHNISARIREYVKLAHIVRASDDDFRIMLDIRTARNAAAWVRRHSDAVLIYTIGSRQVHVFIKDKEYLFPVPKINPVSTIGAGDTFNASILSDCTRLSLGPELIHSTEKSLWKEICNHAVLLAQETCMSPFNYISACSK